MNAASVLALNDRTLAADYLNGIKESVPDTDTGDRERSQKMSFHVVEQRRAHYHRYEARDYRGHWHYFPVTLEDEHSEEFAEVDSGLVYASLMLGIFYLFVHAVAPAEQ